MTKNTALWALLGMLMMCGQVSAQSKKIIYNKYATVPLDSGVTYPYANSTELGMQEFAQLLTDSMRAQGYPYFSIDTMYSTEDTFYYAPYVGDQISTVAIRYHLDSTAKSVLSIDTSYQIPSDQTQKLLDSIGGRAIKTLTDEGYILANVGMDSFIYAGTELQIYNHIYAYHRLKIDSIQQEGRLEINYTLLYKLSGLNGIEYFTPQVLDDVAENLKNYDFIRLKNNPQIDVNKDEVDVVLNLDNRNVNQADVVIGFQPNDSETGKLLITGKADLRLINSFSRAESIQVTWQQLQVQSPRLNASFSLPYIANSNFGTSLNLNYFKKDTTFRTLHTAISGDYTFSPNHIFSLYYQTDDSRIITVDTNKIKNNDFRLDFIDYRKSAYGMRYQRSRMDRRLNPRKGFLIMLDLASKSRKVFENNKILELSTSSGRDYQQIYDSLSADRWQSSVGLRGDKLIPVSRQFVWNNSVQAQYQFAKSLFKNEMYQIGGFQTLRGFDEQSLYVKNYAIWLTEFRYLLGANGYLSTFVNLAYMDRFYSTGLEQEFKAGFGLGLSVFTNSGNFSIQYALGTNDQNQVEFRNGKIHLGYISNF